MIAYQTKNKMKTEQVILKNINPKYFREDDC